MGSITASFNEDLAFSRPAMSSHLTLGFSVTIASLKLASNFYFSSSSSSFFPSFIYLFYKNNYTFFKAEFLIK
jgi:hypothetical protein